MDVDLFLFVMDTCQERFARKYCADERAWWFRKLFACRVVDNETKKVTINHNIAGFDVCPDVFYKVHGFNGGVVPSDRT